MLSFTFFLYLDSDLKKHQIHVYTSPIIEPMIESTIMETIKITGFTCFFFNSQNNNKVIHIGMKLGKIRSKNSVCKGTLIPPGALMTGNNVIVTYCAINAPITVIPRIVAELAIISEFSVMMSMERVPRV